MAELYQLWPAQGALTKSVVFVHGLGGDSLTTWKSSSKNEIWPVWLGQRVEGLAVWSAGYDAPATDRDGASMHPVAIASNLLNKLRLEEKLRKGELVLVGHSLGGLVIKMMLRQAHFDAKDFVARVRKVAFIATPHSGAHLANLADLLRFLAHPSAATLALIRNDPNLRGLNENYRSLVREAQIDHLVLTEQKPLIVRYKKFFIPLEKNIGLIVDPDSADPGLSVNPIPISADHIEIVKPADQDSDVFKSVFNFIVKTSVAREAFDSDAPSGGLSKDGGALAKAELESLNAKVDRLMALLEAKGETKKAEEAGFELDAIVKLAKRIVPDGEIDFDRALKELASAVEIALEAIAKGKRGSNDDEFVDDVLSELAELTKAGQYDKGSKAVDGALAELETRHKEQEEAYRRAQIALLEAGVEQDYLRRDAEAVARRLEQLAAAREAGERPAWTKDFRASWDRYYHEGEQKGVNFALDIAIALARNMLAAAQNADERGNAENLLGIALWKFGERESGTGRLEEAVAAFRAALTEYTRECVPRQWAMTQNNLAMALGRLGEREGGTGRLEEAVAAFRAALTEWTQERVPLDWAGSLGNQGVAMMRLAERKKDLAMARTALAQIEAAYETMQSGGHVPFAGYYEAKLPAARALVDRLSAA